MRPENRDRLTTRTQCTRLAELWGCERGSRVYGDAGALGLLTVERVAADPDAKGLAKALGGGLAHGLVGEGARARDNAWF